MTGLAGCRYQRLPFQYLERWPVGYLTFAVRQCVTRTIVPYYHRLARLKPSRYNLVQPKQPYDYTRILSPICRDLMPSNLGSAPSTRYYPRRSMKAGYQYADVSTVSQTRDHASRSSAELQAPSLCITLQRTPPALSGTGGNCSEWCWTSFKFYP
jgi:hypothetical protein